MHFLFLERRVLMTVVALTGGVAAGKSTVSRILAERGAVVIDADHLARQAVAPESSGFKEVLSRFGPGVTDPSGTLDREALGKLVFSDEVARADLNAIVHPRVRTLYHEKIAELGALNPAAIIVYAVPLLAESRSRGEFDAVVVVDAPANMREERLRQYRGLTASDARSRVLAQATDEERRALADSIIDASLDLETTERAAHELYDELESLWPDRLSELSKRFPRGVS